MTYPVELEATAREAAALADEILARHEARYRSVVEKVQIVLTDDSDLPNGLTTPFPYPLVHIWAVSPDGSDEFGNHDGWLRLVLTHELAHAVHLEEANGLVRLGRKVLGRAPYLFPNSLTPGWFIEGLATYEETMGTAFGRGRNPDVEMVLRSAALANQFPAEDRATLGLDLWPQGEAAYFFGEAFLQDLSTHIGRDVLPDLARVHSGRLLPYMDEFTAYAVTGETFDALWTEWKESEEARFAKQKRAVERRGVTASTRLTSRGVRQTSPRFSPDGTWIAYSSTSLDRFPTIRLMRPDGTEDRQVALVNGESSLSWTPDGKALVYDEIDVFDLFSTYRDLKFVDLGTGKVRAVTRGLRAHDPDVSPDGSRIAFVREGPEGAEILTVRLDGSGLETVVSPRPGIEWSGPRWSPDGGSIAAARLAPGGWLDVVRIDARSLAIDEITHDRAKDVEPAWSPDSRYVVFRSDRDGISNLYAFRLEDRTLLRLTNVLGGAFGPDVSPAGDCVAFSSYGVKGYDLSVTRVDFSTLEPAPAFEDPYPTPSPDPPEVMGASRPYNPLPSLIPRFWSPYATGLLSGEAQIGAATGAIDPLFRNAWGVEVHRGFDTGKIGFRGYYQYDRLLPTLSLGVEDLTDPEPSQAQLLTRDVTVAASLPLERRYRGSQTLSFAWRRERQVTQGGPSPGRLDLSAAEVAWTLNSSRQYPFTVTPIEGWQLRAAALKEIPFLGSDVSIWKATADARTYVRLPKNHALALRAGLGATFGDPSFLASYSAGGFPDGSLFDLVGTNLALLRGFADSSLVGRQIVYGNVEYRFPLAHPERGYKTLPFFLRHVHGSVFVDLAEPWNDAFALKQMKTDVGAGLGGDFFVGHQIPLTWVGGLAFGLGPLGETRFYTRVGLPF